MPTHSLPMLQAAEIKLYKTDRFRSYDDDGDSDDGSDDGVCNTVRRLKAYKVNTQPAKDEWIEVQSGVLFRMSETVEERGSDGSKCDRKLSFELTSDRKDGHQ